MKVHSPHNGAEVGAVVEADAAAVDLAVQRASNAFNAWSSRPVTERETLLRQATAFARTQADVIGRLMALEQGKPLAQSVSEVKASCDIIDWFAAEAAKLQDRRPATEGPAYVSIIRQVPVGVVAMVVPWNYPVALLSWKLGPALGTGCSAVVKPSELTPLCTTAFCEALIKGGLPAGLIEVVNGQGKPTGEALVTHPGVAKVAMTGSTATGKHLLEACAPLFKRITLELGGHCPALVLADADLDQAAEAIAYKAFRNMGQSCSSINRIYAHASIHDALAEKLVAKAKAMSIGDPLEKVELGPMASAATRDKVEAHIKDAVAKGAKLLYGGKRPATPGTEKGYYLEPAVLTQMTLAMLMMREETFGPVAPVTSFTDLDAAVAQANDTAYGLVSYVFTRDEAQATALASRLQAGTVCVNHVNVNTAYGPYQGWKQSGFGVELGSESLHEYLNIQHLKLRVGA